MSTIPDITIGAITVRYCCGIVLLRASAPGQMRYRTTKLSPVYLASLFRSQAPYNMEPDGAWPIAHPASRRSSVVRLARIRRLPPLHARLI